MNTPNSTLTGPAGDDPPTRRLVRPGTPEHDAAHHAAHAYGAAGDLGEAGERGSLSIAEVVVEKTACAAADEIDGVGGAARRVLGVGVPGTGSGDSDTAAGHRPRASARVTGQTAALELRLSVGYPASVRATTEAVRAHVGERIHTLTELTVARVDITVAALTSTHTSSRRRIT